ncbi:hypothetical protein, variant [Aphanomyces astaci]|uniref:Uncharacterized protein n=1 Tax=Aphanomyces astaci TaxID=112090 RepID=W4FBK2_APHAT|nr:hypothetical protein, variant [Aphanomyces astaci]ETV64875.1 hypothetical protein, variant [Aphanomyces astaci]|eukprot:XP_009845640.1 hypothetical protein, variant [Aphanomyces astaci]
MPQDELKAESLRHGSLRYVLEVAPSMLRESDVVSDILIERIRSQEDSEEAVNAILRLMSLHLQSNAHITEQLVELLFTSDYRLCIIHHLPKLTYQSKECTALVLHAYRDLLESDSALVVPIMGSLADMPLTPDQQNSVVDMTHTLMPSIDETDIPVVVRGMLAMLTSSNGDALIGSIRAQCHQLSTHTLHLVVEVMGPFLRQGSISLKFILRAIRSADTLTAIDGIWLVLLHAQDPTTAWTTLTRISRKCTAVWLTATADLALQASHTLVHPFMQLCMLVVQCGFDKSTAAGLRARLVQSGVRAIAYVMQHTRSSLQHDVLVCLLTLTSHSHKLAASSKQQALRWHVPRAAAICIADGVTSLPPSSGHVILDTIYTLSATTDVAGLSCLHVIDTLCFALVQLVARDPTALYALVLLTIQKHILATSSASMFQVTAMLLASHLSYAKQLQPLDDRAITTWMHRLLHTAPLQVVPFICAYLSVLHHREQLDDDENAHVVTSGVRRPSGLSLVVPALVRRGVVVVVGSSSFIQIDRFAGLHASDSGDVPMDALHALHDMVHCLVVHVLHANKDDGVAALQSLLVSNDDDNKSVGTRQCHVIMAIGVCNGVHHHMMTISSSQALGEVVAAQFQAAYDLAMSMDTMEMLVMLRRDLVLELTHALPAPALHVLYLMLHPPPSPPSSPSSHWQLYGTHTSLDDMTVYTPHVSYWTELVIEYGHHARQPANAETLVQLYAILRLLVEYPCHTFVTPAGCNDASPTRTGLFDLLYDQATEQLQDAQAIVGLLDLTAAVAGDSAVLRHRTARLAQSVACHVFPDAALELATWKPYIGRPIAATQVSTNHNSSRRRRHCGALELLQPAVVPLTSHTYYVHHALVTAYVLHPSPSVYLKEILDALTDMTTTTDGGCHVTYRSLTRHTFRLWFAAFWQCLLHHIPHNVVVAIGSSSSNKQHPFAEVVVGFTLVADSFAMVPVALDVDASLGSKTMALMLKACQVLCEQIVTCVDRCLKWRQQTAVEDARGDVQRLSPVLLSMEMALSGMETVVEDMQEMALVQWKAAARPELTKLQTLAKDKGGGRALVLPPGQVKFIPQVLRWIQRARLSLAKTQEQYSIPVGSDFELAELVQWPRGGFDWVGHASGRDGEEEDADRWRRMDDQYEEEEEKEQDERDGGHLAEDERDDGHLAEVERDDGHLDDDTFYASLARTTTVQALQTPQKQGPTDMQDNDTWGFPSIVVDFKATKRQRRQPY